MSMSVRIEESLYQQTKAASQGECLTIAGQLEFWAKVGKATPDNPDFPIEVVSELLVAKKEDRSSLSSFKPATFVTEEVKVLQTNVLARAYKKLHPTPKDAVDKAVVSINEPSRH